MPKRKLKGKNIKRIPKIKRLKMEKTLENMDRIRNIDSSRLRDLITLKEKWAKAEKEKGLEAIKNHEFKIEELNKAVLRLEGIELFIKDLLSEKDEKGTDNA